MKTFNHEYSFYKLSEEERLALVGTVFKTENCKNLYFPFQLAFNEFNYGIQQGLIFVTPILQYNKQKWWRVGAKSPDDLDKDLDFDDTSIRQEVIDYIKGMNKFNRTYIDILKEIQKHFNSGEITS